jgi:hypothetical protein
MLLQKNVARTLAAAALLAQFQAAPALAQGGPQIAVIQGEGAQRPIQQGAGQPIIVELRDASGAPIPRAEVVFRAPVSGPSATFFGASNVSKSWTDEAGRAQSVSITPNHTPGPYTIVVEAQQNGATASAQVQQMNVGPEPVKKKRRFGPKIWIPIAAGALAVIIGLAQRD